MRRIDYIAIAKGIRDSGISKNSRNLVVSSILKNIVKENPLVDKDSFRAMADADIEFKDKKVGFILEKLHKDE
jgi:hypothetical protein